MTLKCCNLTDRTRIRLFSVIQRNLIDTRESWNNNHGIRSLVHMLLVMEILYAITSFRIFIYISISPQNCCDLFFTSVIRLFANTNHIFNLWCQKHYLWFSELSKSGYIAVVMLIFQSKWLLEVFLDYMVFSLGV